MSVTSQKSMSGLITEALMADIEYDSMGAQVLDVLFFDESENEVVPTSGDYSVQVTPNGRSWIDFDGAKFPYKANRNIEDWQYGGFIKQIRAVPFNVVGAVTWKVIYRTHGIGKPSHVHGASVATQFFTATNVVNYNAFEAAVLRGKAFATSHKITVPADGIVSVKMVRNASTTIQFAYAKGVFISYVDGDVTGELIGLSAGARLNNLEPTEFQLAFEYYNAKTTGETAVSDFDRVNVPFVENNIGVIELNNFTSEPVTTIFSVGVTVLGEEFTPFMLAPSIELTPNTEMSTYNGDN